MPTMQETQETWVRSLGQEYPLEEEMAAHCRILAWKIPWTGAWWATDHGVAKSRIRLSTAHNIKLLGSTKPELRRRSTHLSGALDEMAGRRGSSWGAGTPGLLSSMSCSTWSFHQGSPYCSQSSQRRTFQKEEIKNCRSS